jgi:hypothetical protein
MKVMDHRATEPASVVIGHPAVPVLDLQQFCAVDDDWRPHLNKPFRFKGYVYATDGRMIVRVADDETYPACDKIDPIKVVSPAEHADYINAPKVELPAMEAAKRIECRDCNGRGYEHDCPDCECECEACGGQGYCDEMPETSTTFAGQIFDLKYIRKLYSLLGLEIAPNPGDGVIFTPLCFRFEGGIGVLMPMSRESKQHVSIAPSKDRPIT